MFPVSTSLRLFAFGCLVTAAAAVAQVSFPAPSPHSTLKQRVGITDLEVIYSRPSMRGREIYGGLVPYGAVWRTGANQPTTLTLDTAATIGGKPVGAGTYALFTIPGGDEWTIILSNQTDIWGAMGYDAAKDVVRFAVSPQPLAEEVETFTIGIGDLRDESAKLFLDWEHTRVAIPIEVDTVGPVLAQLETVMRGEGGTKPWHQAAAFYFDHGQDLGQALEWIDAAVAENPKAYWSLYLKARILAKLGKPDAARETAAASRAIAEESGNPDYVRLNDELVAGLE